MKLPRATRGTSAPPPNISITTASIRLSYATATPQLRTRRRQPARNTTPQPLDMPRERLGSPFAFHAVGSRAGTPSTVASLTESLQHPAGAGRTNTCAYWLRSSRESEWEYSVNRLQTPGELRVLIEQYHRSGDQVLLSRCHGFLVELLVVYIGDVTARETLREMDLATLMQQAETLGFWTATVLPRLHFQNGRTSGGNLANLSYGRSIHYAPSSNIISKLSVMQAVLVFLVIIICR